MTLNELEVKIRDWAIERNIDKSENAPKQMIKINHPNLHLRLLWSNR